MTDGTMIRSADRYAERCGELEAYVERLAKVIDRLVSVSNKHRSSLAQIEIDDAQNTVAVVRARVIENRP